MECSSIGFVGPLIGYLFTIAFVTLPSEVEAQRALTRDQVIALVGSVSPPVRLAGAAVEEDRANLIGARVFARDNPVLEVLATPRWSAKAVIDVEVSRGAGRAGRQAAQARSRRTGRHRRALAAVGRWRRAAAARCPRRCSWTMAVQ